MSIRVLYAMIGMSILLTVTSCGIKEDLSGCIPRNPSLFVKVAIDESSLNSGNEPEITDVVLYAFDAHGMFQESRNTAIDKVEEFRNPNKPLKFVAWCNTASGTVDVTDLNQNNNLSDGLVSLRNTGISTSGPVDIFEIPADLHYGTASALDDDTEHITIYAARKVASIKVTVLSLQEWAGYYDTDYSIVVGATKKEIDFHGQYHSGAAGYIPASSFNLLSEFIAPLFRTLPSKDQVLSIKIFHGGTLLDEHFSGIDLETGNNVVFSAIENKTLNVLIDYSGAIVNPNANVKVTLKQAAWGIEVIEKPIG